MRSRSRERRPYESRTRERDDRRPSDRNARDDRYSGHRTKRSPSRSRSRSRDNARARDRERMNDSSREFREVKRILSTVGGEDRTGSRENRDTRDKRLSDNNNKIEVDQIGRKKSYADYADSRNDDDRKNVKKVRSEGEFAASNKAEALKENKEKNGTTNKSGLDDEQYDEKALLDIEAFMSKTTKTESSNKDTNHITTTSTDKAAEQTSDAEDSDVLVLWEDEEEVARKEALAAEERRKKRLEIASKYTAAVPGPPLASPGRGGLSLPNSPKGSSKGIRPEVPSTPKVDVTVVEAVSVGLGAGFGAAVGADTAHGSSSISVPTTSLHLAKLALDEETVGHTPAANGKAIGSDAPPAAATSTGVTTETAAQQEDPEQAHLEMERAALALEERRERGMSVTDTTGTVGGYGGYGAGGRFEFDMFSASPSGIEQQQPGKGGTAGGVGAAPGRRVLREALLDGDHDGTNPHLQSNWDDGEGYYKARIGELIGDRFQILGVVGKGVFSTVLKCADLRAARPVSGDGRPGGGSIVDQPVHVAVKLIRNNDTMRKAAEKEKSILLAIAEKDPENKRFCVRLITHLEYRNHVAMVFEYQSMNLRETLKKFGKDVGINIGAIRMYGRQLFVALKHLMDLRVVHADIKLDNILCSGDLKQIKLCDFGSAFRETDTDTDPTPYLVSRFYRAPEIILGMPYGREIDLWSVCVCLYELFTGHVMFPGRTNNEMLKLMMAVKGRFPNKLVKAHMRAYEVLQLEPHFDPDLRFRQYEADPITGKTVLRLIDITSPTRDLAALLRSSKAGADDMKLVAGLTDLLEKGLVLDPTKRLTVVEAFRHPFFASNK